MKEWSKALSENTSKNSINSDVSCVLNKNEIFSVNNGNNVSSFCNICSVSFIFSFEGNMPFVVSNYTYCNVNNCNCDNSNTISEAGFLKEENDVCCDLSCIDNVEENL